MKWWHVLLAGIGGYFLLKKISQPAGATVKTSPSGPTVDTLSDLKKCCSSGKVLTGGMTQPYVACECQTSDGYEFHWQRFQAAAGGPGAGATYIRNENVLPDKSNLTEARQRAIANAAYITSF